MTPQLLPLVLAEGKERPEEPIRGRFIIPVQLARRRGTSTSSGRFRPTEGIPSVLPGAGGSDDADLRVDC